MMKTQTQLKSCAYILSLLGFWSVTLTDYFSPLWPIVITIVICASWFYEYLPIQSRAYRGIWVGLGMCMLLFFPVDIALSNNLLLPAVHLSMFGQVYLLFNPKNMTAYRRIFTVSFAQLLASAILTTDIVFAVILAAYCITAIYGIMLLQLLRGAQGSSEIDVTLPMDQNIPRALFFSSIGWALLLVPLTLGFFYTGPRLEFRIGAGRSEAEVLNRVRLESARTGFSRTVQLGAFGQVQEDQTLALRIEIPEDSEGIGKSLRWRGGALNIYNGVAWNSSRDYFAYYSGKEWIMSNRNSGIVFPREDNLFIMDDRYANYNSEAELDADPRLIKQVCYLEIPYSERIFGAGEIKAVLGPFRYGIEQDFNRSFAIRNREGLPEFISYTAYSEIYEPSEANLRKVSFEKFNKLITDEDYGAYVQTHFLQLPDNLDPRIRQMALEITARAITPFDKVIAIKNFLENEYAYSLDLGSQTAGDPLSNFLLVSKEGHCEYFATAMTVMTRSIGIPARVANGFQKGEWNDTGGFYEVRQNDAHAWVEVYFPGHGWLSFDPSPRWSADEYRESQRSPIARMFSKKLLMLKIRWRKYIVGYSNAQRTHLLSEIKRFLLSEGPKMALNFSARVMRAVWAFATDWRVIAVLLSFLVSVFLLHRRNVFSLSRSWPMRLLRRQKIRTVFYERMLHLLEKKKIFKPPYATSVEFLEMPILREHPMLSDIESLTSLYYRVRFGGMALTNEETEKISDVLKRLSKLSGH